MSLLEFSRVGKTLKNSRIAENSRIDLSRKSKIDHNSEVFWILQDLVPRATPAIVRDNYAESYSRFDVPRATGLMCRELAPKSYSPVFAYSATSNLCFQHVSHDAAITTIQLALQCMLDAKLWMHRSKLRRLCNQHYAT